ncbi:MAG: hypothetical protein HW386_2156 [Gammaproteobacteria bacterium]|nr:hypothetical protein [Gammaproteobacteria bacterium]
MYGKLSLQQAPPLSVPARFFLTAPVFGLAAALILLFTGKDLFSSRWTPGMLAVTHCLTLGFFTSVMIGATQQILPVLIGSSISKPRFIATLIHGQWLPGVALLVISFLHFKPIIFIPAIILIAGAVTTYAGVILFSLYKGISANESAPGIRLAMIALFITMVMGILLVLGYAGLIPLWRPALTNLHLSWGLFGWIGLLIMVVAWQVVPMFQITRAYPAWLRRLTIPAVAVLLLLKSVLVWSDANAVINTARVLVDSAIATVLLCFALATLYLQHVTRRKIRDVHRDFWRLAIFNLLLTLCFWISAGITGRPEFALLTGVMFLLGFAMAVVTGMLLKIVAFLIWLHLQAANEGLQARGRPGYIIPKMKRVIADRKSNILLFSLLLAQLMIIGAILYPSDLTTPAAVAWLVFFSLLTMVLARASSPSPSPPQKRGRGKILLQYPCGAAHQGQALKISFCNLPAAISRVTITSRMIALQPAGTPKHEQT